jgi:hypothetical protein
MKASHVCNHTLSRLFRVYGSVLLVAALGACSTAITPPPNDYGQKHLIKTSTGGDRPAWVDNLSDWQKQHPERVYAVGVAENETDYSLGRDNAYADALKHLAQKVKNTTHVLYLEATTEDRGDGSKFTPDVQKAVENGTLQTALGIITGAGVDSYYWRKYWVQTAPGAPILYVRDVNALVSLSKENFQKTVYQTLNRQATVVKDPRAQQVLRDMKNRWLTTPSVAVPSGH